MIRNAERLKRFEADDARRRLQGMSYEEALAIYRSLWAHAAALNAEFPSADWRRDVEPDIELARVLRAGG